MSAFAWWEWLIFAAFLYGAWGLGWKAGTASAPSSAGELIGRLAQIAHLMDETAKKQKGGADKMETVCELFRETALALDKTAEALREDGR